jgi:hypothetical protein
MLWSVPATSLTTPVGTAGLADARLHSPLLRALAAMWLLLWSLIGLVETAPLIHHPRVPIWHPVVIVLISTAVVATWLWWALKTRRFQRAPLDPPGRWFRYHLRALPLLIVGCIVLVYGFREAAYQVMNPVYSYLPLRITIFHETIKVSLFYGLWLALMYGLLTLAKWREESERLLGVQKALAEAQLAQLQAQLRPHFLFNALNTVSSLMHTDTARADRVLAQLGDLLRASLGPGRTDAVPLREELGVLRKYAEIMEERFDGRAVLNWDIADDALETPVPAMLLQPLLENAFKHGVERSSKPVHITVRAARTEGALRVEIHNSGSSLKRGTNGVNAAGEAMEGQVGLRNCRERLRLIYGESAQLVVADDAADGVRASVTLPCPAQAA